jgi:two-component system sensor histidine kinase CreC
MRIGLRIFLGYFLIVGLAAFFVMRVFVDEVKPGVRQAMESSLVDSANSLAVLAAADLRAGHIADGTFAKAIDGLSTQPLAAKISGVAKEKFGYRIYVANAQGIVVYDSWQRDVGKDYSHWNDVYLTLRGRYGARSTRSNPADEESSVMHVAAPIHDGSKIIGVLTVARENRLSKPFIAASRAAILRHGAWLLGLSFLIGLAVTFWLARSVDRLGRYAKAVTEGERAVLPDVGGGEFGELGRALETMRARLDGKQYVEHYVQTLAHEMKSPLAAIRGAAEILEESPPAADRERFLRHIAEQSQRLSGMIDKVLALAAVEHQQALENVALVDLGERLSETLHLAEPRLALKSLAIAMRSDPGLPMVMGDRFLLGQAIGNLLDNAIDFSPSGGVIAIHLAQEASELVLRIEDAGPGIPEFACERVFERFFSLSRPDGARSSGLGLSFVREVAALHHGTIMLANRAEGGAIASLRLPIRK